MRKFLLFLIICFISPGLIFALYIDNYNDGSSPNLLNGDYGFYNYPGATGSLNYISNSAFGNSGKSLKFDFNVTGGYEVGMWMNIYTTTKVDFTQYDYLTLFILKVIRLIRS